jgi:hypothetical protein
VRTLQAATVLGLVACLIGQVASAVVLSKHALAFLPAIPGTALARRVHMMCSYWSFVFAFAHAGLQMKGVVARMCREKTPSPVMKWAARIACAAIAAVGAVSFVQLDLAAYLTGRVQFAAGDPSIALSCARWASVAVLVAGALYLLRSLIEKTGERRS